MYPKIDEPQNYSAALYLRLSKEDEEKGFDDSESIKNQRSMLMDYAEKQKLKVYDIYVDDGITGTTDERPSLQKMTKDIESKKVNLVITKDLSRLSRNYIDAGYYMEKFFPEHRTRYISLLDNVDTERDGYTSDIVPFKALLNDFYAKDISKKIASVKRDKQRKGLFIGGKAPYGYKKSPTEKNVIIIDEPAAENVRYMFKLALEGLSCREIAMTFNNENIPTPSQYAKINLSAKGRGPYSGKWSSERISEMLRNEVYIGNMVQGRMRKASYKSKKCNKLPRDQWIVVENTHEPIIDKETFEKVGMLIQSRNHTRCRTYDFLLKGLIYCHECGYPLGVMNRKLSGNKDMLYSICRTYQRFTQYHKCTCHCTRVEDITKAVIEQVREVCRQYIDRINLAELNGKANSMLKAEMKRQKKDISELKCNLEAIKNKIDKMYDDKLSGMIDDDDFRRCYNKMKAEQAEIETKIKALKNSNEKEIQFHMERTQELVTEFLNTEEYSRELLVSLIKRIELTENKEILIYFKIKELEPTHLC